jgi:hypothetical protein
LWCRWGKKENPYPYLGENRANPLPPICHNISLFLLQAMGLVRAIFLRLRNAQRNHGIFPTGKSTDPRPSTSKARLLLGELGILLFCSPGFCGVGCLLRARFRDPARLSSSREASIILIKFYNTVDQKSKVGQFARTAVRVKSPRARLFSNC